jgi:large subunit ribosomal protein L21
MKYAIIEISGKQILVEEGKHYVTNRLPYKEGSSLQMNRILLCSDNGKRLIGHPYIENSENIEIKATILEHLRGPKVTIFKMRPKKKTRLTKGHRQSQTRIMIDKILTNEN